MLRTAPSLRKKLAVSWRAPLPWRSIAPTKNPASATSVGMITSRVATGSAKRLSTT